MLARSGRQRRPTSCVSYRLNAGSVGCRPNVGAELGMKAITRNARQCTEATTVGFAQNSYRRATVRPRAGRARVAQPSLADLFRSASPSWGFRLIAKRSEEHTSELQSLRHLVC